MKKYDVIVVGAGVGGLAAACKLAKEGVKTLLLEKHNIPGGALTSFRRGRFEIESGVHYVAHFGTKEKPQTVYKILDEFGVAEHIDPRPLHQIVILRREGQEDIYLPNNYDDAVKHLKETYPEEIAGIDKYFEVINGVMKDYLNLFHFDYDYPNPLDHMDPEATPEKYPYFHKYAYMPTLEFMAETGIKNRDLFFLLTIMSNHSGPPQFNTVIDLADWMYYILQCAPVKLPGGFQQVSSLMAEKVEEFGGEVIYNQEMTEIIVENGAVAGVRTSDGKEYRAPVVMYNGSPLRVFRSMVKPGDVPAGIVGEIMSEMKGYYDFDRVGLCTYFCLDCPPEEVGITKAVQFCQGAGSNYRSLYQVDCTEAMGGVFHKPDRCNVTFFTYSSYRDWISCPPEEYHKKKMEAEAAAVAEANRLFPGFSDHIEEVDVFTPVTIGRYLGHPGGSFAGFRVYNRDYLLNPMQINNRLPGLYFVGGWFNNVGCVHPCLAGGYGVAKAYLETIQK